MDESSDLDAVFWVWVQANRAGQEHQAAGLPGADCYLTREAAGTKLNTLLSALPNGIGHVRFEDREFILDRCEGVGLSIKTAKGANII